MRPDLWCRPRVHTALVPFKELAILFQRPKAIVTYEKMRWCVVASVKKDVMWGQVRVGGWMVRGVQVVEGRCEGPKVLGSKEYLTRCSLSSGVNS